MLQIIIVVFREILEISLILGILSAATKNIEGRSKWIISGLAGGIMASLALAFFTDKISESFQGLGQEVFNGMVLLTASILISTTVIWMQKHAKTLSGELKHLSELIKKGKKPLYALMIVILLSVLREGSEIVLFTYSSYISGVDIYTILTALIIGCALGLIVGGALYLGIIKAAGKYFFMVTTYLLIFLASGLVAQSFGYFLGVDLVPSLGNPIWDSSNLIAQNSFFGRILNIFFGYIDRPAGIQLLAYFINLIILIISLKIAKSKN